MNFKIKMAIVDFFLIALLSFIVLLYTLCNNRIIKVTEGNNTYYFIDSMQKIILTTKEKNEIVSYLYGVDIFNYDGTIMNDYSTVNISVSERHHRVLGSLEIKGTYENQEIIEKLFNEINIANKSSDKYSNMLTYIPSNHNMKDMHGRIYIDKNEFEIALNEDVLLNPSGLDFKLHNPNLHQLLIRINNKKIRKICFNIALYLSMGIFILLSMNIIIMKYYKKKL